MARSYRRNCIGALVMFGIALSAAVWAVPTPSHAQTQCGEFYRIKRGDTLRDITTRTLGHDRYRVIYQANRDILPSPERLETGQLIYVPCAKGPIQDRRAALAQSGRTPSARDNLGDQAAVASPTQTDVAVVTPYSPKFAGKSRVAPQVPVQQETPALAQVEQSARPLNIITASGISPLADFPLPSGGLLSVLIKEALAVGGNSEAHKISFVEDRQAHLSVLMPTGTFDLTFPWPGVDCTTDSIGPAGKTICRDFLVSRPVYEATVATFLPAESALAAATSLDALQGAKLCRPAGFPPVDLEAMGLGLDIVIKRTASDCIAAIRSGEVQGMSIPIGARDMPKWSGLVMVPGLAWQIPVHALAWRSTPNAEQTIATLDAGLKQLQRSGRWFQIVSTYLHDVNERTAEVKGN